ncbi:unnamed protein product [Rotaria sordida]|uniref:SWIM-type domain-containing protein n=1 Tax=Rotaria sordida TaxID=392033 RepID=A0A815VRY6_9BILA|nr:unnamed protein product [Rotaria sordida]
MHKRVLINSKHNYICHSCDVKDLTELFIPTKSITNEQLSMYCETLSYITTDFKHALHSDIHRLSYDLLNNEQCESFNGLTKHQIQQLATEYKLNEENIFLFYTKCNTDNSDFLLSQVFGISDTSISRHFNQSIEDLFNSLVTDQMGPTTWDRKNIDMHTSMFAKELLQVNVQNIVVCMDSFPIYIEKPGDFTLQKLTWPSQTLRNCIKFHCNTTLDGTFVGIQGGYGATGHNNEESIVNSLTNNKYALDNDDDDNIYHNHMFQTFFFKKILKNNDILILDRDCYAMKLSKRYFTNSIDHMKIYEHQSIENCIKVVGINSRKPEDTKFYCSCKSGARPTNLCTHALSVLMLIQSIQKKLPHLELAKTIIDYPDAIKNKYSSSHYQAIHNNIIDCEWMAKCCTCHELYHPSCIGQDQEKIDAIIDKWKCPYC